MADTPKRLKSRRLKQAARRKDPAAVRLGRRGGKATGKKLSRKQREERARAGAIARWKKAKGKGYQPPP